MKNPFDGLKIFSTDPNDPFTIAVCAYLTKKYGEGKFEIKPGKNLADHFPDSETKVVIEETVNNARHIVVIGRRLPNSNVNDSLMAMLLTLSALKGSSEARVIAALPCLWYARQDRKTARTVISARLIADFLVQTGISRAIILDPHAGQEQGFFPIYVPVDTLSASPILIPEIRKTIGEGKDIIVVSPDNGGSSRAGNYAAALHASSTAGDKRRDPRTGRSKIIRLIGDRVKGRTALIVDDIVDTGGSVVDLINLLRKIGVGDIYCAFTHPVLSGEAVAKLTAAGIKRIWTTDSVPPSPALLESDIFVQVSVAELFADAIWLNFIGKSLSENLLKK